MAMYPVLTRRWTRAEYDRLIDIGVFLSGEPLELLGGELIVSELQGSAHYTAIGLVEDALRAALGPGWLVRSQGPIELDDEGEPEPYLPVRRGDRRSSLAPTRAASCRRCLQPTFSPATSCPRKELSMKAAVFHGPNKPLTIENVVIAKPIGREVLVRTVASGVCHSDLHFVDGYYPFPTPAILGHEAAGIVEAVGPHVTEFKAGDHVIACLSVFCGHCSYCLPGPTHPCHSRPAP